MKPYRTFRLEVLSGGGMFNGLRLVDEATGATVMQATSVRSTILRPEATIEFHTRDLGLLEALGLMERQPIEGEAHEVKPGRRLSVDRPAITTEGESNP